MNITAADMIARSRWQLSSSSDRRALDVVDGRGMHEGQGPHYSRRTRDSKTFTGVGQEVVLVTRDGRAVWACIYQRTPSKPGTGASRGRTGQTDEKPRYLWRNMMFRNLGAGLSSELIQEATEATYWALGRAVRDATARTAQDGDRGQVGALPQPRLLLRAGRVGASTRCEGAPRHPGRQGPLLGA